MRKFVIERNKEPEIEWPYLALLRVAASGRSKNEQTRGMWVSRIRPRVRARTDGPANRAARPVPRCRARPPRPANRVGRRGAISARLAETARDWAVSRPRPKLVSQPSPCLEVCTRPWACGVTMYRKILDIAHAPYVTWGTQLRVDPRGTRAWRSFPWMAHLRRGNLWLHYGKSWAVSGPTPTWRTGDFLCITPRRAAPHRARLSPPVGAERRRRGRLLARRSYAVATRLTFRRSPVPRSPRHFVTGARLDIAHRFPHACTNVRRSR